MSDEEKNELTEEEQEQKWEESRAEDMEKLVKWKINYQFPEPFLQKDLQKFQTRIKVLRGDRDIANSVYNGIIIRVAIELGWVTNMTDDDIGMLHPGKVTLLSSRIFGDVVRAQLIPNE